MQEYLFAAADGRIDRADTEEGGGKERAAGGPAETTDCRIFLMSLAEFGHLEGDYPHKRRLYRSMSPVQYCKLERFAECIQGTVKVPGSRRGQLCFQSFGFYYRQNRLLLVEDGTLLKNLLGKIGQTPRGRIPSSQVLLLLFESLIEDDVISLQQQEERLSSLEEGLLKKQPENFYEMVIHYRRQLTASHAYYEQLVNIGDQVQGDFSWELSAEERMAWQLFTNRACRLHDHVELLKEYLVQIRELYQALIDVQQNKVMSILTVVTTIFLPLTLIAGWYGMNFPDMPEFAWPYAYPAVALASVLITTSEIVFFRKKKML